MNKYLFNCKITILVICILSFIITGCKKKEPESPFTSQLPDYNATVTISTTAEIFEPTALEQQDISSVEMPTELSVSAGSVEKPTNEQIQIALKNAGYYDGEIDGKIGRKSQQAILDFQKDNGLVVDGKVGPKTWAKLNRYLNPSTQKE